MCLTNSEGTNLTFKSQALPESAGCAWKAKEFVLLDITH